MAIRPPQGGSSDPEHIEFGIAALDARLDEAGVEFPATDEDVLDALENTEVPFDGAGNTLDLREAFARLPRSQFDSEAELLDVLHPVFEDARRSSGGFLGRLRALLPF